MADVENHIFNDTADYIRFSVNRSNSLIQDHMKNKNTSKLLLDETISFQASVINNYNYLPGGHWMPTDCLPRWKVAIVIPFRNRSHHLPILLDHMIPMLQRQRLEFGFYVVEQANNLIFNRAMLMNVGFLEALNFTKWDCYIFHDVDHLSLNDYNYYGCSAMPRHFVSGSDRWKYKLPYDNFFGAVTGLTTKQIKDINGFPNVYWGWGGEDDEIWNRVKETGMEITRVKGPKGHYDVIHHHHQSAPLMKERHALLKSFKTRYRNDGLSNIVYRRPIYTLNTLYTNISVNIQKLKVNFKVPVVKDPPKRNAALQSKIKAAFKPKPQPKKNPPPRPQRKPPPKPQPKQVKVGGQPKVVKVDGKAVQVHPA